MYSEGEKKKHKIYFKKSIKLLKNDELQLQDDTMIKIQASSCRLPHAILFAAADQPAEMITHFLFLNLLFGCI